MPLFLLALLFFCAPITHAQDRIAPVDLYSLEQYQQRVLQENDTLYVVNFWATWCSPCVRELPHFKELSRTLSNLPIKFILISLDAQANLELVEKFVQKRKLNMETHLLAAGDPNIWINTLEPSWQGSIPATFLYYKGTKRSFYESAFANKKQLESFINNYK